MSTTTLTPPLALSGDGYTILIAPEAETLKWTLLERSATITTVTSDGECNDAREHMKGLAAFLSRLEKSRKEVKAPVVAIGKDIDARAADCGRDVELEQKRLSGIITHYAAEQERKRREAEAAAQRAAMEAQRKAFQEEQAKLAAERAELEAEQAKLAAERAELEAKNKKARAAASALAEEARIKAQRAEEARLAEESAAAAREEALWAQEQQEKKVIVTGGGAPAGVKPTLDFEVLDVHAFYRAHAPFCEVTVKRREVLAMLNNLHREGIPDLTRPNAFPGLRVIESFKVSTR